VRRDALACAIGPSGFIADGAGSLKGRDDARKAAVFTSETLPPQIAFDHGEILADYLEYLKSGKKPSV
jgi:8-oxo-dGTP diphosphatase